MQAILRRRYWTGRQIHITAKMWPSAKVTAKLELTSLVPLVRALELVSLFPSRPSSSLRLGQLKMAPKKLKNSSNPTRIIPQQPTTSPAASLPTETLAQILDVAEAVALHEHKPEEAQSFKITFGLVCRHWYSVAFPLQAYYVKNWSTASRLAQVLKSVADGKERVIELTLVAEEKGTNRGLHLAELLVVCPKVTRLKLTIEGSLGSRVGEERKQRDGSLGKPVREALLKMNDLGKLVLKGKLGQHVDQVGQPLRPRSQLEKQINFHFTPHSLFQAWPNLRAPHAFPLVVRGSRLPTTSPDFVHLPALTHLSLHVTNSPTFTEAILNASRHKLKSLRIGCVSSERISTAALAIRSALGGLTKFQALDSDANVLPTADNSMGSVVKGLVKVESLKLGVNLVHLPSLFAILPTLTHLRTLEIAANRALGSLPTIPAAHLVEYLEAAEGGKLRSIILPQCVEEGWSVEDLEKVTSAAVKSGVNWSST